MPETISSSWNKENESAGSGKKAAVLRLPAAARSVSPSAAMRYARGEDESSTHVSSVQSFVGNDMSSGGAAAKKDNAVGNDNASGGGRMSDTNRRRELRTVVVHQPHHQPTNPAPATAVPRSANQLPQQKQQYQQQHQHQYYASRRSSLVSRSLQSLPRMGASAPSTPWMPSRTPLASASQISIGVAQSHSKLRNYPMVQSRDMAIRETGGIVAPGETNENVNPQPHQAPHSALRNYPMVQSRDEAIRRSTDDSALLSSTFAKARLHGGFHTPRASIDNWRSLHASNRGHNDDEDEDEEESVQIRRKLDTVITSSWDAYGELERWRREFAGLQRLWHMLQGGDNDGQQHRLLPNIKPAHVSDIVRGIRNLINALETSREEAEHEMKSLLDKCVELGDERAKLQGTLREHEEEHQRALQKVHDAHRTECTELEAVAEKYRGLLADALRNSSGTRTPRHREQRRRPKSWPRDATSPLSHSSDNEERSVDGDDADVRRYVVDFLMHRDDMPSFPNVERDVHTHTHISLSLTHSLSIYISVYTSLC